MNKIVEFDFDGVLVDTQTEVDKEFEKFGCIISI